MDPNTNELDDFIDRPKAQLAKDLIAAGNFDNSYEIVTDNGDEMRVSLVEGILHDRSKGILSAEEAKTLLNNCITQMAVTGYNKEKFEWTMDWVENAGLLPIETKDAEIAEAKSLFDRHYQPKVETKIIEPTQEPLATPIAQPIGNARRGLRYALVGATLLAGGLGAVALPQSGKPATPPAPIAGPAIAGSPVAPTAVALPAPATPSAAPAPVPTPAPTATPAPKPVNPPTQPTPTSAPVAAQPAPKPEPAPAPKPAPTPAPVAHPSPQPAPAAKPAPVVQEGPKQIIAKTEIAILSNPNGKSTINFPMTKMRLKRAGWEVVEVQTQKDTTYLIVKNGEKKGRINITKAELGNSEEVEIESL